jgi:hypothetical protein
MERLASNVVAAIHDRRSKETALTRLRGASAWQAERRNRELLYNFEHGALAMARGGTGK